MRACAEQGGFVFYLAQRSEQALPPLRNVPDLVEFRRQPPWTLDGNQFDQLKARLGEFVG